MSEKNGDKYIKYEDRNSEESVVYFTRDLSPEGLKKIYERVNENIDGKIAIKLHTGEPHGPNIIPSSWIKEFVKDECPEASIIETNTYYAGDRDTTEKHRKTLEINGWNFCPVDITDEDGTVDLPVVNGKIFDHMTVGKNIMKYDSLITLTHFKGHIAGGFGGSNKNIGIGCADGKIGKAMIHTYPGQDQWSIGQEDFMERITESTKATVDHFKDKITFVNVMRNMSVSCDCEGVLAEPVVTPNVGILGSRDICALDTACIDLVYAMKPEENHDLVERIESRHGLRQLSYMHELGMGNTKYKLIDIDNGDIEITQKEAVKDLKPFNK